MRLSASIGQKQHGFTLIELMIAVIIIGILAAIAVPSYRRYMVQNAESEAQAQIGQLQIELERWRTSALSYRGFYPISGSDSNGLPTYGYIADDTLIYVPLGSDANSHRYQIRLFDGDTSKGTRTLVAQAGNDVDIGAGRSWVMVATPNPNGIAGRDGHVFVQRSTGMKCKTIVANQQNLTAATTQCTGSGLEAW